MRNMGHQRTI